MVTLKNKANKDNAASSAWVGAVSLLGMLGVFAGIVGWVTFSLREDVRSQLIARDAHVLRILLQNSIDRAEQENLIFAFEVLEEEMLWEVLLDSSTAEGVFATQMFSPGGRLLQSTSDALVLETLPDSIVDLAKSNLPYSDFQRDIPLSTLLELDYRNDRDVTILGLYLPLLSSGGELLGVGRFLLDGSVLAQEFKVLDSRLIAQASVAIGLGGALIVGLFLLAWWRLDGAKKELLEQAERLRRANSELAMVARTSAVGSVAAHLIHGLRNPLAGLRQVVRAGGDGGALESEDWKGAQDAANRMQSMVEEVVGILQDSGKGDVEYDLDLSELASEVSRRFYEKAGHGSSQDRFEVETVGGGSLDSHRANIVILIVTNLVQNAFEAVRDMESGKVQAMFAVDSDCLYVSVKDNGPGIDESLRGKLFEPVPSLKEGGAGIGLAISHQMARHVGGELECAHSNNGQGCTFELRVPLAGVGKSDV